MKIAIISDIHENVHNLILAMKQIQEKKCDVIFMFDDGELIDQGTYNDLYEKNTTFKLMADNS